MLLRLLAQALAMSTRCLLGTYLLCGVLAVAPAAVQAGPVLRLQVPLLHGVLQVVPTCCLLRLCWEAKLLLRLSCCCCGCVCCLQLRWHRLQMFVHAVYAWAKLRDHQYQLLLWRLLLLLPKATKGEEVDV